MLADSPIKKLISELDRYGVYEHMVEVHNKVSLIKLGVKVNIFYTYWFILHQLMLTEYNF